MPRPILAPGLTTGDELILYGERDFIGVESRGDDPRGINAAAAWTRRAKASAIVEHDEEGVHNTPRIPRGMCVLDWDQSAGIYVVDENSYLMGEYQRDNASLYTVATVSDGVFDLTLDIAMPSTNYGIISMCESERRYTPATDTITDTWAAVWGVVTSTTKIRITRKTGVAANPEGYDGPCAFLLCG